VPRQRVILAVLAAAAAVGVPATASAKSKPNVPCEPPHSGYVACMQVVYQHGDDGDAEHLEVKALLMQRAARCAGHTGRRTVTVSNGGKETLARARRAGRCRNGLVRWTVKFSSRQTQRWNLQPGESIDARWSGTSAKTSVEIAPPPKG
jgi:hypothetical protein